jgi:uncharacterized protein (DUF486 family)
VAAGLALARKVDFAILPESRSGLSPQFWKEPAVGLSVITQTTLLLIASNVFMTFAWYGHLRGLKGNVWYVAALVSWGIALFEYLLQVPANRIGHAGGYSVGQLKIMQEVITLGVFVPFSIYYLREGVKLDYLWAALCLCGAVYFVFRSDLGRRREEPPQTAAAAAERPADH